MTRFLGGSYERRYFSIAFLALCILIIFGASLNDHRSTKQSLTTGQAAAAPIWPLSSAVEPFGNDHRTVFPYSIIPGGVESRQELRQAVTMDPVVARHYSDFDLANVRRVTVSSSQLMYVSYRIGNNVFWTKHKLTLLKGETMLTDGHVMVRTRCGNRVSAVPINPHAVVEPTTQEFNTPAFAPLSTPSLAAYSALPAVFPSRSVTQPIGSPVSPSTPIVLFPSLPGGGGGSGGGISSIPPSGGGGGGTSPPPVVTPPGPPVGVPEPGTAGLVLAGLGAAWLTRRNRKAR